MIKRVQIDQLKHNMKVTLLGGRNCYSVFCLNMHEIFATGHEANSKQPAFDRDLRIEFV